RVPNGAMTVVGQSFTQGGGLVSVDTNRLLNFRGCRFIFQFGYVMGALTVSDATVDLIGNQPIDIIVKGSSGISGYTLDGQQIRVVGEPSSGGSVQWGIPFPLHNHGYLNLTSAGGEALAEVRASGQTITNSGELEALRGTGGVRRLFDAGLENTGLLDIG